MLITCISTSNTKKLGENSTSTKVCNIVGDIIKREYKEEIEVRTIALMDYDFKSCVLCGECADSNSCIYDEDFNKIFSEMGKSDAIFLVVPHYSTIPSKLTMMFEKINEIVYAGCVKDENYMPPIAEKVVGIIGHGGMPENEKVLKYYHENLITPVAKSLQSLSFKTVEADEEFKFGIPFGLIGDNCYEKVEGEVYPKINHNFEHIESRIKPLVKNVVDKILIK